MIQPLREANTKSRARSNGPYSRNRTQRADNSEWQNSYEHWTAGTWQAGRQTGTAWTPGQPASRPPVANNDTNEPLRGARGPGIHGTGARWSHSTGCRANLSALMHPGRSESRLPLGSPPADHPPFLLHSTTRPFSPSPLPRVSAAEPCSCLLAHSPCIFLRHLC